MFEFIKKHLKQKKGADMGQVIIPKVNKYKHCIVIGSPGSGKVSHPWDYLDKCVCGSKAWIMYNDKEPFYCGGDSSNVYVLCPKCGNHTEHGNIESVFDMWDTLLINEKEKIKKSL